MNVSLDERSDLYSVGVSLFELLTGVRPLSATEPLELLHQHLAVMPPLAGELRDDTPVIVSKILARLLEKSPDQRYQSARGLEHDLAKVRDQLQQSGYCDDFELGHADVPDRYRPSGMLFGRDSDRMKLQDMLSDIRKGSSLLCNIKGYSGIGKTSLARQLRVPVIQTGGLYAEGKCDQYQRVQPYSAWVNALESLLLQILEWPVPKRNRARDLLQSAVGENGKVLTDMIPTLEVLLGEQPQVSELGAGEAQNRLNYLFVSFLTGLGEITAPLVIFLDDLQWMDSNSMDLLTAIIQADKLRYLLIIGAYRDNEVDQVHPLHICLCHLNKTASHDCREVVLDKLSQNDLAHMIHTTLKMPEKVSQELATVLYGKSGGNPFFSHQLLKGLAEQRILFFDEIQGYWNFDAAALEALQPPENVVDFLLSNLRKFPPETQQLLKIGSCIGHQFNLVDLSAATEWSEQEVEAFLKPAIEHYLIQRVERD
jgi:predicted ATPase